MVDYKLKITGIPLVNKRRMPTTLLLVVEVDLTHGLTTTTTTTELEVASETEMAPLGAGTATNPDI